MSHRQIALVDDNRELRRILSLFLELEGFDVASWSGREPIADFLRETSPKLLVIDFKLGGSLYADAVVADLRADPGNAKLSTITYSHDSYALLDRKSVLDELNVEILPKLGDLDGLAALSWRLIHAHH